MQPLIVRPLCLNSSSEINPFYIAQSFRERIIRETRESQNSETVASFPNSKVYLYNYYVIIKMCYYNAHTAITFPE